MTSSLNFLNHIISKLLAIITNQRRLHSSVHHCQWGMPSGVKHAPLLGTSAVDGEGFLEAKYNHSKCALINQALQTIMAL